MNADQSAEVLGVSRRQVYEGQITHWMPLPPPPIDAAIDSAKKENT